MYTMYIVKEQTNKKTEDVQTMEKFMLECTIENIELKLNFQDLTKKQEAEAKKALKEAKKALAKLS